eukprot:scaffold15944_cov115-Isochrysis_galbana.AAC.8
MSAFEEVFGVRGLLVKMGLGAPSSRAFVAGGVTAAVLFATTTPKAAFTDEGEMRPWSVLSPHPSATQVHFLAYPLGVAAAVYLFT